DRDADDERRDELACQSHGPGQFYRGEQRVGHTPPCPDLNHRPATGANRPKCSNDAACAEPAVTASLMQAIPAFRDGPICEEVIRKQGSASCCRNTFWSRPTSAKEPNKRSTTRVSWRARSGPKFTCST